MEGVTAPLLLLFACVDARVGESARQYEIRSKFLTRNMNSCACVCACVWVRSCVCAGGDPSSTLFPRLKAIAMTDACHDVRPRGGAVPSR